GEGRTDLDDRAAVPGNHPAQSRLGAPYRREVGHLRHPLVLVRGVLHERREDRCHGVVDPYADFAEVSFDPASGFLDLDGIGDVGRYGQAFSAQALDVEEGRFESLIATRHHCHRSTTFREVTHYGSSHATGGTGHHHDSWWHPSHRRRAWG